MTTCQNTLSTLKGKDFLIKAGNGFAGDVTFTTGTDLVGAVDHGLSDGDQIVFATVVTTTSLAIDTVYYVVTATASTFQVALTEGGTPIAIDADGTGTADEYFRALGGIQDGSISFAAEAQEITNSLSNEFREYLDKAGVRSMTVSGSGLAVDDWGSEKLRALLLNNCLWRFQICLFTDGTTVKYWEGCYKLTGQEQGGAYNAAQTFSLTLESSGEFAYNEV